MFYHKITMIEGHYAFIIYFTMGNLFVWGLCDVSAAQFIKQTKF